MKFGIIVNTSEPETVWNAFRFGTTSLLEDHEVEVFLLGKGVESEDIESEKFNVKEQMQLFVENQGKIYACGTCLKLRQEIISFLTKLVHIIFLGKTSFATRGL